jgi:hypothetical protein
VAPDPTGLPVWVVLTIVGGSMLVAAITTLLVLFLERVVRRGGSAARSALRPDRGAADGAVAVDTPDLALAAVATLDLDILDSVDRPQRHLQSRRARPLGV